MQGFSDHLVSEALYLADPDGIGIEVYRDRPRDEWPRADGRLQMATEPLDTESLLREAEDAGPFEGLVPGTVIGHVHLHVSFLEDTEAFYTRALGMELTTRYGRSALFFAAGGYHHHIAANIWAGIGAPRPPDGAIGLKHFEILMPSAAAVTETLDTLRAAGASVDDDRVRDPAGNAMRIVARAGFHGRRDSP
jgi:catechol 2,3-dioxygenase